MQHLIWVCTVCLCPTKRTVGLCGLISFILDFQICLTSFFCIKHPMRATVEICILEKKKLGFSNLFVKNLFVKKRLKICPKNPNKNLDF